MAHEEKGNQEVSTKNETSNPSKEQSQKRETLEERLQRIEAEAAKKMKLQKERVVETSSETTDPVKKASPPRVKEETVSKKVESTPVVAKEEKTQDAPVKRTPQVRNSPAKTAPVKEEVTKVEENKTKEAAAPKPKPVRNSGVATKNVETVKEERQSTTEPAEAKTTTKPEAKKPAPRKKATRSTTRKKAASTKATAPAETEPAKENPVQKQEVAEAKTPASDEVKEAPAAPKGRAKKAPASRSRRQSKSTTPAKEGMEEQAKATTDATTPATNRSASSENPVPAAKKTTSRNSPKKRATKKPKTAKTAVSAKKTEENKSATTSRSKPTAGSMRKPVSSPPVKESDKDLYINSTPTQVEIALMENGKLVELHHQKTNNNFTVGDIFLGSIKRLMPGLNAAFVDIGHKKDAFLHYTDLGPKLRSLLEFTDSATKGKLDSHTLDNFKLAPEIIKTGKIDQVLNKRDNILVQVLKEPIGTKGPRLSCEITIPGRFLVLTPFVDVIAVSKKIGNSEERKRLKMLIESIKPKNFGVIVRTAAEGKKVQDLHEELKLMMDKWETIYSQLQDSKPPMKLLSELDKASSILRDVLNDSFNNIVVNDKELYGNIKTFMGSFAPEQVNIVGLHRSRTPIFDSFGVTKQIKSSFGKTATMASGAYLVIEHTEAMHVIDVNSGHKMSSSDQEEAVLSVNLESAEEIARQMRLRDIGGIIIVDFIDMRNKDNKLKLVSAMRHFMKKDRAQHTILPLSKFGLMQITRQRVRPEVKINTAEVCPSCSGTGKINPSILLVDSLERDLAFILQSRPKSKLVLHVHPYVEAYLKKGLPSIQMKWYMKFYKWIKVRSNADFSMTAYKFFDGTEDEIRLK